MAPKRNSTAGAGRPSKMAKKDTDMGKCEAIAVALELAEKKNVPASVIALLGPALKHCLPTFKEDRHSFQVNILDMAAKTLAASESALISEVAFAEATVNGGDEEKAKREAAVLETDAAFTAAQEEHKVKQASKLAKAEALKVILEPLKLAQANQKSGDADAESLEKTKAALEATVAELLTPMKETGGSKRQLANLSKQLTTVVETSLLEAMELPLLQKPEKRGTFDAVIIENLETQILAKKTSMEAKLQEEAPAREARAGAVTAAQEAHDTAKAEYETAATELKAAKEAEAAAKDAAATAKAAAKTLAAEILEAASQLDNARKTLEEFRSGPKAFFQELLERTAPALEPEEPAAPAAADGAPAEVPVVSA
mmetsp:Transcript_23840/g.43226  ORF Transcript_23840/g.43226 Transcript_23840/m.43226 type:complete len:371 (-) Transcript_23840:217-1329(-)